MRSTAARWRVGSAGRMRSLPARITLGGTATMTVRPVTVPRLVRTSTVRLPQSTLVGGRFKTDRQAGGELRQQGAESRRRQQAPLPGLPRGRSQRGDLIQLLRAAQRADEKVAAAPKGPRSAAARAPPADRAPHRRPRRWRVPPGGRWRRSPHTAYRSPRGCRCRGGHPRARARDRPRPDGPVPQRATPPAIEPTRPQIKRQAEARHVRHHPPPMRFDGLDQRIGAPGGCQPCGQTAMPAGTGADDDDVHRPRGALTEARAKAEGRRRRPAGAPREALPARAGPCLEAASAAGRGQTGRIMREM